ncbi:probable G-protein coupled receptor [Nothobranchius furzeri]|uniref:G-protein coupled receptor n=3 Tax=Nothobranchius furzeri TaxID=105023 RepID=A0A8C6L9N4_NOTFU|nr:probable G-protein coupled receptor [Nothobranchius furzeri]XP_054586567.1 probable G-protein coupled receptor [Nothobranchius furzeri]KAF7207896.1 putative G-protein coupled receptor [Nothobranchius furzeri]
MEENRTLLPSELKECTSVWSPMPSSPSRLLGAPPNPQTRLKDLTGMVFMVTLNVLALLANTAVLVVVIKAPHFRKFAFVCHLCAVDLLCAILLMPLGIVSSSPYFADVVFTMMECQVYVFLIVILIAASIFTITAISVERYYYIVHPMRYEVKMTLKLTAAVLVLVWVAAATLGLSTVFKWPSYGGRSSISAAHCLLHWSHSDHRRIFSLLFSVTCFCLPSVVIFAVYCNVYKVARVAARQHRPLPSWTINQLKHRSDSINSQTTIITTHNAPRRRTRDHLFGRSKAALTLVVIVGQFLICWLPYFAFHFHLTLDKTAHIPPDVEVVVTWLAYSSFAMNPFFYGLLNRQIREELLKLRRCYSSRPAELAAYGHDGPGHENFLQFLRRTSCTLETRVSFATPSHRSTLDQTGHTGFRIPGQIPEEFS